jgi:hypothetical protein
MIGHGVLSSSFSNQIKNHRMGSKKLSIVSPLLREKDLNAESITFLKSRKLTRDISGNSSKNSSIAKPTHKYFIS